MKHWASFYKTSTDGSIIPAVGSDSILPLDGRWGIARSTAAAKQHQRQHNFVGYMLHYEQNDNPYYVCSYLRSQHVYHP